MVSSFFPYLLSCFVLGSFSLSSWPGLAQEPVMCGPVMPFETLHVTLGFTNKVDFN